MSEFRNKTAIITGAGQGIGKEIASQLASHGGRLILNDLDPTLLSSTVEELNDAFGKNGGECIGVAGDAGDIDIIDRLVVSATSRFRRLDLVIANAGVTTFGNFLKYQPEDFEELIHLDLQEIARASSREKDKGERD